MSLADVKFKELCRDVLENGTSTEGQKNRPHWEDGSTAYTIKQFGKVIEYDLRKEFPAITLRRTAIKSAFDEILWIYQRKSNNIKDLNSHIWDQWANEYGSIGKAYGYQAAKRHIHRADSYPLKEAFNNLESFSRQNQIAILHEYEEVLRHGRDLDRVTVVITEFRDQVDMALYQLKHEPFSRRIMLNLWDFGELTEMNLQPCCWSCNFNVTDEGGDKLVLNMVLNQRSSDILTANNWNVVQYSLLLMMFAQVSGMVPGKLVHVMTDAHIYDRHVDIVKELIERPEYAAPKVTLNPDIMDFYKFTQNDVIVSDYNFTEFKTKIDVAI